MLKICLKALCRFAALRPVCFYCVFMTSEQRECKIIWQVFGRWWGFKGQEQGIGWDTFWQWSHRACIMCREKEGKKKKTASDLNFLHTPSHHLEFSVRPTRTPTFFDLAFLCCMLIYTNVSISFPFMLYCWSLLAFSGWARSCLETPKSLSLSVYPSGGKRESR